MTRYYIRAGWATYGPYDTIAKARRHAIREIKSGKHTYRTSAGYPSVAVSTNMNFAGVCPQVVLKDGEFRWNTWDFGNMANMPIVNADGTLRRRS